MSSILYKISVVASVVLAFNFNIYDIAKLHVVVVVGKHIRIVNSKE